MTDRNALEEDLDRVLAELEPEDVGRWDWEPPLGSPIPATWAASAEPFEPEDADDESDREQEPDEDA